ncbi:hypothetical protein Q4517_04580 [Tenacibaculum sp. 1_MG-2023]|uniref:hypothetical protein n=1 Tax=Tenacibaculum sp. 1_MG-2023 TaxID=3062653 RepID=UPI0026E2F523|nr:hypothetical protein [Tenacibaculum sp. 1_MG-2023]MDO6674821.1 hypothetical protein [Tenacibaculum sp. 1_MG-2023]
MKKIQILAMILLFMINNLVYSQSSFRVVDSSPKSSFSKTSSGFYRMSEAKGKIKRVYYYEKFNNKAIILNVNKKKYKINNFNIDLIDNSFVSKINNDSLFVFSNLEKAYINNKEFIKKGNSIYEVLVEGKKVDLKVSFISFKREEIIDKLNGKVIKPAHYRIKKEYVLVDKISDKVSNLNKIKKKTILSFIDKKNKKMLISYAKKKKLSYRKEKDVEQILKYYNSL